MATKKKNALGKGLNALIPETSTVQATTRRSRKPAVKKEDKDIITVKIDQVEPNKEQPRKAFEEESLQELADSIKQFGIIQPLVVMKKDDYYEIIAGERRWRAAKIAGLKEIPVVIKEYKEEELVEIALIENIQREDLNPIEEAVAYKRLMEEFKLTQEEVAKKVSKSRSAVTNSMRLLKLPEEIQGMVVEGVLSMGHARTLLAVEDEEIQKTTALKVADEKLSVRETEKLVKKLTEEKKEKPVKDDSYKYIYQEVEENLKQILGNKVSIKNKKNNKGKIEIEYYSQDDLDRIVSLLRK